MRWSAQRIDQSMRCHRHDCAGTSSSLGMAAALAMYFATEVWPMSMPSLRSSPWILGAPQIGLARLISRTSRRISSGTLGLPLRDCDFQRQNKRNPARCNGRQSEVRQAPEHLENGAAFFKSPGAWLQVWEAMTAHASLASTAPGLPWIAAMSFHACCGQADRQISPASPRAFAKRVFPNELSPPLGVGFSRLRGPRMRPARWKLCAKYTGSSLHEPSLVNRQ